MAKKGKGKSNPSDGHKVLARNKRATFDYQIDERFEAGIALVGSEVKSIRDARVSLGESYATFDENGELWLEQAHIAEYPWANRNNHEPTRRRKLLLNKRELGQLSRAIDRAGFTLLSVALYLKGGLIKVELGLGKGKKVHDKRDSLKKRAHDREIERAVK